MANATARLSCWRIGMDCERLSYVRSSGRRSISVMDACTLIARKEELRVCIRCMGQSYERYAN